MVMVMMMVTMWSSGCCACRSLDSLLLERQACGCRARSCFRSRLITFETLWRALLVGKSTISSSSGSAYSIGAEQGATGLKPCCICGSDLRSCFFSHAATRSARVC